MTYGERLKQARKEAGLTQASLADRIGNACTQENISKLERGGAAGSEHTALFADACGVTALWLSTGKGPKYPSGLDSLDSDIRSAIQEAEVLSLIRRYLAATDYGKQSVQVALELDEGMRHRGEKPVEDDLILPARANR